jgi:heptosyltransferase-2
LYPPNNVGVSEAEGEFGIAAPASQWATKKWPLDRWIAWLDAEAIQSPDRRIVLIGGPADVEELREIAGQSSHDRLEIRTDLSLLESAGWMKAARWVVTNDSGPMHMASAVNAPTVAIFCSTVPSFGFGPLSSRSVVVEKEEELVCRPCGMHGKSSCPLGHFECGTGIAVDQVRAAVARF